MSDAAVNRRQEDAVGPVWREQFLLPLKRFPIGLYPTFMMSVFFLIPFIIMLVVSFATRTESTYEPGFEFTHYARFFSPLFTTHLLVSVQFSVLASILSVMAAVPFTYFISRFRRRPQVIALVFLLCVLTLSEVIVAYSLSVVMSRSSGLPSFVEWLGLIDRARSWYPGYLANLFGLSFFNIPFAVLILFPSCTRLDRELTEAAQTMGASPFKSFLTIVLPLLDRTIMAGPRAALRVHHGRLCHPDLARTPRGHDDGPADRQSGAQSRQHSVCSGAFHVLHGGDNHSQPDHGQTAPW